MRHRSWFVVGLASVFLACSGAAISEVDGAGAPLEKAAHTFYVSRQGDGSDGRSWATAWTELDQIDWTQLGAGDVVLIDGGDTSMTYETTLTFGRSGEAHRPIVLRASDEPGHAGQIVLHGGRAASLPYCGQKDFTRPLVGEVRLRGISSSGQSWIYVDGGRWGGMQLTGFGGPAIELSRDSEHLTFRNMEVTDNGSAAWREDGTWYPFGTGVLLAGERVLFERALIHDNGGDGLRTEGEATNVVVRRSWIFNTRSHPTASNEPFNHCAEPSGLHVAPTGQNQHGLVVEDSIVGPGFSTGLLLSDARVLGEWGVMNDVLLRNVTLVSHEGDSASANLSAMQPPGHAPTNVRLEHVTSVRPEGAKLANVAIRGGGHSVSDSLFLGGGELFFEDAKVDRVCRGTGVTGTELGDAMDPIVVKKDYAGLGVDAAGFDFSFDNRSPCQGLGSRITSVSVLMQDGELPDAPAVIPNTPPTISFLTPSADAQVIAGEPVAVTVKAQDGDGQIAKVEFQADGSTIGEVTLAPFTLTWTPSDGINTLTAIATDDDGATSQVVVQVNAAGKPKVEFEAEDGTLTGGFTVANGCVMQTTNTAVGAGGRAEYTFTVTSPGTYVVKGTVTAPSDSENSFFFNIDGDPSATAIWDLAVTPTPLEQLANWRGSGTQAAPEFGTKTFTLTAGQHTLVLEGREPNACIDRFKLELAQ